jgi:hypothetical protein
MNIFVDLRFWLLFIGLFGIAMLIQYISFLLAAKKDEKEETKNSEEGIN